jgi:hypothetical protein
LGLEAGSLGQGMLRRDSDERSPGWPAEFPGCGQVRDCWKESRQPAEKVNSPEGAMRLACRQPAGAGRPGTGEVNAGP